MGSIFSVREIQETDIELLIQYWQNADDDFLIAMGVDLAKLPSKTEWESMLNHVVNAPIEQKKSYCIIWLEDGEPIGHSNVNKILFADEAYMHLHLWNSNSRQKGIGVELVKKSIPLFFENLKLEKLFCEPFALNPAPNNALKKIGFEFQKSYTTIPGSINFEQPVNLWMMSKERKDELGI